MEKKNEEKKLSKKQLLKMLLNSDEAENEQLEDMIDLLIEKNVSIDINTENRNKLSLGEKMADKMTKFAGSWRFLFIFSSLIIMWILLNILLDFPFDEYPFILLNLFLSCVAALQAPVIMMSQLRQEKKDRLRSDNDYKTDLKSEFILEDLHTKLSKVMKNQNELNAKLDEIEKKLNKK